MADTKFCEDCALFRGELGGDVDRCAYPRKTVPGYAMVRKSAAPALRQCSSERGYETEDSCGRAAKWFKPKTDAVAA